MLREMTIRKSKYRLACTRRSSFHQGMAGNEFRDTPGRLLLGWAVLFTALVILAWRIHLRPTEYEWTEYPTALGDTQYYAALGKDDRYEPNLRLAGQKNGLYRRSEAAQAIDDATMLKSGVSEEGAVIYQRLEDSGKAGAPVFLKCGENRYIEFGARKFYPPFVPLQP